MRIEVPRHTGQRESGASAARKADAWLIRSANCGAGPDEQAQVIALIAHLSLPLL
jgi:hypothetical protein